MFSKNISNNIFKQLANTLGEVSGEVAIPFDDRATYAYGVLINEALTAPGLTRIGNATMAQNSVVTEMGYIGTLKNGVLKQINKTNGNLYVSGAATVVDGSAGDLMSYMPPFYFYVEQLTSTTYNLWVSPYKITGFSQHPGWCVGMTQGVVNNAAIYDTPITSLWSVKNATTTFRGGNNSATYDALPNTHLGKPRTRFTRPQFYAAAQSKGTDYGLIHYSTHVGLCMLFYTKYATRNTKAAISGKVDGYFAGGLGNGAWDATTVNTDWSAFNGFYPVIPTGQTIPLGYVDGEVTYTQDAWNVDGERAFKQNCFMGIEAPFASGFEFMQGINIWKQTTEEGGKHYAYIYNGNKYDDTITGLTPDRIVEYYKGDAYLRTIMAGANFDMLAKGVFTVYSDTYFCDTFSNAIENYGIYTGMRGGHMVLAVAPGLAWIYTAINTSSIGQFWVSRLQYYGSVRVTV